MPEWLSSFPLVAKKIIWFQHQVVGRRCFLWSVCSLDKTLLGFVLLHIVLQGQTFMLFGVSLDFLLLHFNPSSMMKTTSFFSVSCRSSQNWPTSDSSALVLWHRFALLRCWMICLGNKPNHSAIFSDFTQACILHSFVDREGYSISSMGFLPTVVGIMVIWIKFTHSCPF